MVGVDATPDVIRRIAARPEVAWVNHNPKVDVMLERDRLAESPPGPVSSPDEIECGVNQMRAPEVWNELGVTGDGAIIAVIDTGVCWSHPDIVDQMWINPGEDLDGDRVVMTSSAGTSTSTTTTPTTTPTVTAPTSRAPWPATERKAPSPGWPPTRRSWRSG